MNKTCQAILLALLAAIPAAHAQTYNWTETGSSLYGDGAGTLTLDQFVGAMGPYGLFSIGAFTGYIGSTSPSADVSGSSIAFTPDDGTVIFYDSLAPGNLAAATIDFSAGSYAYEINGEFGLYVVSQGGTGDGGGDAFTLSLTPVPEASLNPALLAAAGLFIGWRSWRTVRTAKA
jgi:hypothetical protein